MCFVVSFFVASKNNKRSNDLFVFFFLFDREIVGIIFAAFLAVFSVERVSFSLFISVLEGDRMVFPLNRFHFFFKVCDNTNYHASTLSLLFTIE